MHTQTHVYVYRNIVTKHHALLQKFLCGFFVAPVSQFFHVLQNLLV